MSTTMAASNSNSENSHQSTSDIRQRKKISPIVQFKNNSRQNKSSPNLRLVKNLNQNKPHNSERNNQTSSNIDITTPPRSQNPNLESTPSPLNTNSENSDNQKKSSTKSPHPRWATCLQSPHPSRLPSPNFASSPNIESPVESAQSRHTLPTRTQSMSTVVGQVAQPATIASVKRGGSDRKKVVRMKLDFDVDVGGPANEKEKEKEEPKQIRILTRPQHANSSGNMNIGSVKGESEMKGTSTNISTTPIKTPVKESGKDSYSSSPASATTRSPSPGSRSPKRADSPPLVAQQQQIQLTPQKLQQNYSPMPPGQVIYMPPGLTYFMGMPPGFSAAPQNGGTVGMTPPPGFNVASPDRNMGPVDLNQMSEDLKKMLNLNTTPINKASSVTSLQVS